MRPATYGRPPWFLPVTRLRVGRVVLLAVVLCTALIGGTVWLLTTKARPFLTPMVDSTAWPAWLRQAQSYPTPEPAGRTGTPAARTGGPEETAVRDDHYPAAARESGSRHARAQTPCGHAVCGA